MSRFVDLITLLPRSMQVAIVGILLGGIVFAAHEQRYMTVGQFTRSYVLDLRTSIREIQKDLANPNLHPDVRVILVEQLALLIDELCYEMPLDPYCERPK